MYEIHVYLGAGALRNCQFTKSRIHGRIKLGWNVGRKFVRTGDE
jgi:hypothetical protein